MKDNEVVAHIFKDSAPSPLGNGMLSNNAADSLKDIKRVLDDEARRSILEDIIKKL